MAFSLHVKPFVPRWRPAEARAGKGPQLASSQRLPVRKPGRMESARRRHSSSPVSTCSPNRTLKRGTRGDSHPAPRLSLSDPGPLTRGDPRAARPPPPAPGKSPQTDGGGEEGRSPGPTDTHFLPATPASEAEPHSPMAPRPPSLRPLRSASGRRSPGPRAPRASPAPRAAASDGLAPPSLAGSRGSRLRGCRADPSLFPPAPRVTGCGLAVPAAPPSKGPLPSPPLSAQARASHVQTPFPAPHTLNTHYTPAPSQRPTDNRVAKIIIPNVETRKDSS